MPPTPVHHNIGFARKPYHTCACVRVCVVCSQQFPLTRTPNRIIINLDPRPETTRRLVDGAYPIKSQLLICWSLALSCLPAGWWWPTNGCCMCTAPCPWLRLRLFPAQPPMKPRSKSIDSAIIAQYCACMVN